MNILNHLIINNHSYNTCKQEYIIFTLDVAKHLYFLNSVHAATISARTYDMLFHETLKKAFLNLFRCEQLDDQIHALR